MANIDSATLNDNRFMQAFGNTAVAGGSISLTAAPSQNDIVRICRIPAGTAVYAVVLGNTDMDSNGSPALTYTLGFQPVSSSDGPTADYTAFSGSTDQTDLQAANSGKLFCNFTAVTFEKDVYLSAKITNAAATWANGSIKVTALGIARGIK